MSGYYGRNTALYHAVLMLEPTAVSAAASKQIPCEHRMTNGVDLLLLIGSGKIGGSKGNCAPNASW